MEITSRKTSELGTLLKICIVCSQCLVLATSSIVTDPTDKNVYEGTDVVLNCIADLKNTERIEWYVGSTRISENSRYRFTRGEQSDLNYSWLHINHVETTDTGKTYYCAVYEDEEKKINSKKAVLNVTRVPQTVSPDCRRLDVSYNEGEQVEVVCAQENTNPRVHLAIYKGNEFLTDTSGNFNTQKTFQYISKFLAHRDDDGVVIWCAQTPPTNDYPKQFRHNCSFGNININYSPSISINGATEVKLDKNRNQQEVVFVCTGMAKPSTVTYNWVVDFPPDPSVRYIEQHNGNTLRLLFGPTTFVHVVNLTCIGSNIVGRSSISQTLRIIHESLPTNIPEPIQQGQEFTWSTALILAVTGSCGLCIALFTAVIIGFYHFQLPQSMDIYGERIAQPEVYFEPKDGISSPQILDGKHSVGVQVSELTEIESVYTEVSEYGIKKEKDKTLPENNSYSHV